MSPGSLAPKSTSSLFGRMEDGKRRERDFNLSEIKVKIKARDKILEAQRRVLRCSKWVKQGLWGTIFICKNRGAERNQSAAK